MSTCCRTQWPLWGLEVFAGFTTTRHPNWPCTLKYIWSCRWSPCIVLYISYQSQPFHSDHVPGEPCCCQTILSFALLARQKKELAYYILNGWSVCVWVCVCTQICTEKTGISIYTVNLHLWMPLKALLHTFQCHTICHTIPCLIFHHERWPAIIVRGVRAVFYLELDISPSNEMADSIYLMLQDRILPLTVQLFYFLSSSLLELPITAYQMMC